MADDHDHQHHHHHHHHHEHGPGCNHDHDHDHGMDDQTLSVQIANQIINVANKRLEEGLPPEVIAAGLRHAAANFSAFVAHHMDPDSVFDGRLTDEFQQMVEYYAGMHGGGEARSETGLHNLVKQVKDEF